VTLPVLVTFGDRAVAAIPFVATSVVTLLSLLLNRNLLKSAAKSRDTLLSKIEDAINESVGRILKEMTGALQDAPYISVYGLPSTRLEIFDSITAWVADVGTAFAGAIGQVVATGLLFYQAGTTAIVPYVALITVILLFVFSIFLITTDPAEYKDKLPSKLPFQYVLIISDVVLAGLLFV
jgi:hypothetical protein